MKHIKISDVTMKQPETSTSLSFKEKIELAKLLDKLGVNVIELEGFHNSKVDALRIKSIASAVKDSIIAVPVALDEENVTQTWNALHIAKYPRLQVCAAVSSVQMEYIYHKKPDALLAAIAQTVAFCKSLCADVEFVADDATRGDPAFMAKAVQTAIDNGAATVTVCDTAGTMMPEEFSTFVKSLYMQIPVLHEVTLAISCANTLSRADACSIAASAQCPLRATRAAERIDDADLIIIVNCF